MAVVTHFEDDSGNQPANVTNQTHQRLTITIEVLQITNMCLK